MIRYKDIFLSVFATLKEILSYVCTTQQIGNLDPWKVQEIIDNMLIDVHADS